MAKKFAKLMQVAPPSAARDSVTIPTVILLQFQRCSAPQGVRSGERVENADLIKVPKRRCIDFKIETGCPLDVNTVCFRSASSSLTNSPWTICRVHSLCARSASLTAFM